MQGGRSQRRVAGTLVWACQPMPPVLIFMHYPSRTSLLADLALGVPGSKATMTILTRSPDIPSVHFREPSDVYISLLILVALGNSFYGVARSIWPQMSRY